MDHNDYDHVLYEKIRSVDHYINETVEDDENEYGMIIQALFISYLQLRSDEDPHTLAAMLDVFCRNAMSVNNDDELRF